MLANDVSKLALKGGTPVSDTPVPIVKVEITEQDIDAAVAVLRSGMLAQGRHVAELEQRFAQASDAPHAIACANGTCALQLAYEPLFRPGDEVLVPAWTYIATVSMVVARGATPVFCEVHAETFNLDAADAEARITPQTRAIAATHLYGNPADIAAIEALAKKHNLRVIYDAAQAHLATYNGRGVGAYGDAVTYSFYATKNMTTGEGGMVTVRDGDLDAEIRLLRSHGETKKYYHERVGYNYRMTDLEAALGVSQLGRLPALTDQRRANAAALDERIGQIDGLVAPRPTPGAEHVYHLYTLRIAEGAFRVSRDEFIDAVRAEGVQAAVHYPFALTQQPCFKQFVGAPTPVSESLAQSVFCVPVHHGLDDRQIDNIGEALAKVADAYRA